MLYKVIDIFIHIHYNTRDYFPHLLRHGTVPRPRTRRVSVTEDETEGHCQCLSLAEVAYSFVFPGPPAPCWFSNLDFNNKLAFKFLIIVADWGNFNFIVGPGRQSRMYVFIIQLTQTQLHYFFLGGTSQQSLKKSHLYFMPVSCIHFRVTKKLALIQWHQELMLYLVNCSARQRRISFKNCDQCKRPSELLFKFTIFQHHFHNFE